ncbi:hypothetical protein L3i22_061060 [Actinoplanes sp. L3-i22]|nr:hypothetical protein L3i22_061060 [Actinoplanes sp. L3-i22]
MLVLVLVIREPLLRALGRQAESRLGMDLPNDGRLLRGVRDGRTVRVISWNDLLHTLAD